MDFFKNVYEYGCVWVPTAVIKTMTKCNLRRGFISTYIPQVQPHHWRESGQELSDAEATEDAPYWLAQPAAFLHTQDHLPGVGSLTEI